MGTNGMNKVRITAIRQTVYPDLMAKYENPIEHTCDVREGQQWISENTCVLGIDGACFLQTSRIVLVSQFLLTTAPPIFCD